MTLAEAVHISVSSFNIATIENTEEKFIFGAEKTRKMTKGISYN